MWVVEYSTRNSSTFCNKSSTILGKGTNNKIEDNSDVDVDVVPVVDPAIDTDLHANESTDSDRLRFALFALFVYFLGAHKSHRIVIDNDMHTKIGTRTSDCGSPCSTMAGTGTITRMTKANTKPTIITQISRIVIDKTELDVPCQSLAKKTF